MGIMDFIKGELLEIIEWTDDSRDTLSWRFPDEDKAIKNGAQLIVRESQVAQFVYLGEFGDTFKPGKHTLTTDNIPVLTKIKSWPFGFNSPFKADVYFVVTRLFTGNKWGTSNPVMLRDNDFGIVRVRAFGTYDFKIVEPRRSCARSPARTTTSASTSSPTRCARASSASSPTRLRPRRFRCSTWPSRYTELGDALLPLINPAIIAKYGIEITSFIVENVSVPPEVEQAIDKRSSMAAVGNLNDFVKYQMGKGLESGAGGAGAAGTAAELAVGFGLAQQMMKRRLHERPRGADGRRAAGPRPQRRGERWTARAAQPGRSRAGARRVGGRRDGRARVRRSEGQEDRRVLANLARRAHCLHVAVIRMQKSKCNAGHAHVVSACRILNFALHDVDRISALEKHECPACGAQAEWNPAKQKLVCPFCGTESPYHDRSRAGQSRRARSGEGAARAAGRGARMADRAAQRAVPVVPRGHGVRSGARRPELRVLRLAGARRLPGDQGADPSAGRAAVQDRREPRARRHPALVAQPVVRARTTGDRRARRHHPQPLHSVLDLRRAGALPVDGRGRPLLHRDGAGPRREGPAA